jgi:hypothetical protein
MMNLDYEDFVDSEKMGYALGFAAATQIFRNAIGDLPEGVVKGLMPELEAAVWTSFELSSEAGKPQADFYYEGNLKAVKEFKQSPNIKLSS